MKIGITFKIITMIVVLSLLIFAVLAYINNKRYQDDLTESFIERAKFTTYSLEASVQSKDDLENKEKLMLSIQKHIWLDSEILYISFNVIQGNELRTYVSNDPNRIGKGADEDNILAYEKGLLVSRIIGTGKARTLKIIDPVKISGQKSGTIEIDFTLENVENKIKSNSTNIVLLSFGMILAFVLLMFLSLRTVILRPILKISDGVKAISKNKFGQVIEVKTKDEIGNLARTFNTMTMDLKDSRKKLEEYSKGLEKQVRERTKELETSKKELEGRNEELEKFNRLAVGRELRMIELKKKIRELEEQLQKNP